MWFLLPLFILVGCTQDVFTTYEPNVRFGDYANELLEYNASIVILNNNQPDISEVMYLKERGMMVLYPIQEGTNITHIKNYGFDGIYIGAGENLNNISETISFAKTLRNGFLVFLEDNTNTHTNLYALVDGVATTSIENLPQTRKKVVIAEHKSEIESCNFYEQCKLQNIYCLSHPYSTPTCKQ